MAHTYVSNTIHCVFGTKERRRVITADPAAAAAQRLLVVAPAQRSPEAQSKAPTKRTADDLPVHSFRTLLEDLRTVAKNRVRMGNTQFDLITTTTALQQRAFDLLQVSYRR